LWVIRPADANETAIAWKLALERKDGPTALMLTRQNVPVLTAAGNAAAKGAYILAEADDKKPQMVLIASGSEVSLAMEARLQLARKGIQTRVVSMPCWELFDAQSKAYQKKVLPPEIPHLTIEAGVTLAWSRYLGCTHGASIGLDHFGASAPYQTLFEQYGFTVENVVRKVKKLLSEV
jgi:transketolase